MSDSSQQESDDEVISDDIDTSSQRTVRKVKTQQGIKIFCHQQIINHPKLITKWIP